MSVPDVGESATPAGRLPDAMLHVAGAVPERRSAAGVVPGAPTELVKVPDGRVAGVLTLPMGELLIEDRSGLVGRNRATSEIGAVSPCGAVKEQFPACRPSRDAVQLPSCCFVFVTTAENVRLPAAGTAWSLDAAMPEKAYVELVRSASAWTVVEMGTTVMLSVSFAMVPVPLSAEMLTL